MIDKEMIIHWTGGIVLAIVLVTGIGFLIMNDHSNNLEKGKTDRQKEVTERIQIKECKDSIEDDLILALCINGITIKE